MTTPDDQQAHTREADRSAALAVAAFPAFILIGAVIAFIFPSPFLPWTNYITYFLMIIMFGMGLTLTIPDFKEVVRRPIPVLIGVVAQFVIMPLGAVLVAKLLRLNPALAVGLLMLGSVPGGTSSNVIAFLAKGDVALSVAMTSVSTLIAPFMTPILMLLLAGESVDVDAAGMAKSLAQTVLIPVIGGIVLRYFLDAWMEKISPVLPWISILGIGGVVFPTVAKNKDALLQVGAVVFLAVLLHNVLGYVLGYYAAKLTGQPESYRRTVAIEVGTQSAGLSSGMAGKFFSPEAALPGAVAAVLHNITGPLRVAGSPPKPRFVRRRRARSGAHRGRLTEVEVVPVRVAEQGPFEVGGPLRQNAVFRDVAGTIEEAELDFAADDRDVRQAVVDLRVARRAERDEVGDVRLSALRPLVNVMDLDEAAIGAARHRALVAPQGEQRRHLAIRR